MKLAFAGGGSGGHIYPALAVARALRARAPGDDLRFFITKDGLEGKLIGQGQWPVHEISAARFTGKDLLRFPLSLTRGVIQAWRQLRDFAPDAVVGAGGFVATPTVLAAALLRIPAVLLEQNCVAGRTNRFLARFARTVITTFDETEGLPSGCEVRPLGNPLRFSREDFVAVKRQPGVQLVVLGGSQGARILNDTVSGSYADILASGVTRVVHVSGHRDHDRVKARASAAGPGVDLRPYWEDMGTLFAQSHLVLCRGGATTLSELIELGRPGVVVPIASSVYDHQRKNGRILERAGGAVVLEEKDFSIESLLSTLKTLAADPPGLDALGSRLDSLRKPDAAARIAGFLAEEFGGTG